MGPTDEKPVLSLAIAAILGAFLLAGCQSAPVTEPMLQETVQVGTPLFQWGESRHFGPEPHSSVKRINAHSVDVTEDLGSIGISFQGAFIWTNSTAMLRVERADGSTALELEAGEGLEDDVGPIGSLFEFRRLVAAETGTWSAVVEGRGNISTMDLRLHGIEAGPTGIERTFTVEQGGIDLRLRIEALTGFGQPPSGHLEGPDGSIVPLSFEEPRGGIVHDWSANSGDHVIVLDTTGWGGHLSIQVLPV